MAIFTDSKIKDIVNLAYAEMTGQKVLDKTLDLSAFCDNGTNAITEDIREGFTKSLLVQLSKIWYTDTSYRSQFVDPYFEDVNRFGSLIQMVHAEVPEVKDNSAWSNFESGVTQVGVYTVYLPVVDNKLYAKSASYALPITITGEQWDTAFKSEEELASFVGYLFLMVDNALAQHQLDMSYANRNNFMAQKIYADSQNVEGIHVLNLVEMYAKDRAIKENLTVESFMANKDCLLYAIEQLQLYIGYLGRQNRQFNVGSKARFTPKDRLVVELLSAFEKRLSVVAKSTTFHDELLEIPNYSEVPAWQSTNSFNFNEVSSIKVKVADLNGGDSHIVEQSGIVAFVADKWAIAHTVRGQRVASQHFNIENLTQYEYQYRDQYINNLTMNGIVFVIADYVFTA